METLEKVTFGKKKVQLHSLFAPILLSLILHPCAAESANLLEVYQLAQKNDPTFLSVHFQREATKEQKRQAIAHMLPTLAGTANYTYTEQDVKSSDNDVFDLGKTDYDATSYGLTLSQPIFDWGLIVGYKQSKARNLWADAEYTVAQQNLIVRVANLYLRALAARDQLGYAQAEQKSVAKHYELAYGRHKMGLIPITDLHDAKARLASTQAITIEAQNLLDDALIALQEVTGDPVTSLNPLSEATTLLPPEPAELDIWITQAVDKNASIEVQKQAIGVADFEVSRQFSVHYPTLDAVGNYKSEETDGTVFGGGGEIESLDVIVQFTLPLYQGGLVSSRVREAKHQLSAARQALTRQVRAVQRLTRSSFLGVNTALSQINALQQSITSNRLALEAKQEGYLSGLYTSLNVLDAERDLSLVSIDYSKARYRYLLNSLQLKQAVGTLNDRDVTDLNEWFSDARQDIAQPAYSQFLINASPDANLTPPAITTVTVEVTKQTQEDPKPTTLKKSQTQVKAPTNTTIVTKTHALVPPTVKSTTPKQQNKLIINGLKAISPELSADALKNLEDFITALELKPESIIAIQGFVGSHSNSTANQKLSLERAVSVKKYLISKGIAEEMITTEGMGNKNQLASNSTSEGRKKNRRVEITHSQ